MDKNSQAAAAFYRAVRDFAQKAKTWDTNVIFYETKPDEQYDLSLVSRRVYGTREEFLAVMAAAGLDSFDEPLPQTKLRLPNALALMQIKRNTGFESRGEYRDEGSPVWAED